MIVFVDSCELKCGMCCILFFVSFNLKSFMCQNKQAAAYLYACTEM